VTTPESASLTLDHPPEFHWNGDCPKNLLSVSEKGTA
jgi:hypothetical protein